MALNTRLPLADFFTALVDTLEPSNSQSAEDKAKGWLRQGYAQKLFKKQNVQLCLTVIQPQGDHILCVGIMKRLLVAFEQCVTYSFNWFVKIKVILNQCWNFQVLSKTANSNKKNIEVRVIRMIDTNTFDLNDISALNMMVQIHDNFRAHSNKFRGLKGVRGALNWLFKKFNLSEIVWTNDRYYCKNNNENCYLCNYMYKHSEDWRNEIKEWLANRPMPAAPVPDISFELYARVGTQVLKTLKFPMNVTITAILQKVNTLTTTPQTGLVVERQIQGAPQQVQIDDVSDFVDGDIIIIP